MKCVGGIPNNVRQNNAYKYGCKNYFNTNYTDTHLLWKLISLLDFLQVSHSLLQRCFGAIWTLHPTWQWVLISWKVGGLQTTLS